MSINAEGLEFDTYDDIAKRLGIEHKPDLAIKLISNMSVEDAFGAYLEWHGIIGWSRKLIEVLDDIRKNHRE